MFYENMEINSISNSLGRIFFNSRTFCRGSDSIRLKVMFGNKKIFNAVGVKTTSADFGRLHAESVVVSRTINHSGSECETLTSLTLFGRSVAHLTI